MPVSPYQQLSKVIEMVILTDPKSILDVGMGFGTYGVLCREYLDLWDKMNDRDFYKWNRKIDGIEIFEKYITPLHRFIYSNILIGDARTVVPALKTRYDLALLIDVIEHLTEQDGINLLKHIRKVARNILITTPRNIGNQGALYGNRFEIHLSQWTEEKFKKIDHCFFVSNDGSIICYLGEDSQRLKPLLANRDMADLKTIARRHWPCSAALYFKISKIRK